MKDKPKEDAPAQRAKRIHQTIDDLKRRDNDPSPPRSEEKGSTSMSPREFIQKRMRELGQKKG